MPTDAEMRAVFTAAYRGRYDGRAPSVGELQALHAVAWSESNYGDGWKDEGVGSFNLGAIQAGKPPCDPSRAFLYTDTHPTSSGGSVPYEICFRRYPSLEAGADDLVRVLFVNRPAVREAAARGDLAGVSRAMYESGYYEGVGATVDQRIANHVRWLEGAVSSIASRMNEAIALRRRSPPSSRAALLPIAAALALLALVVRGVG